MHTLKLKMRHKSINDVPDGVIFVHLIHTNYWINSSINLNFFNSSEKI